MPQQNIPPYYFPTTSFSLPYNFLTLSPFTPFTTKKKAPRNAIQHCRGPLISKRFAKS